MTQKLHLPPCFESTKRRLESFLSFHTVYPHCVTTEFFKPKFGAGWNRLEGMVTHQVKAPLGWVKGVHCARRRSDSMADRWPLPGWLRTQKTGVATKRSGGHTVDG